MDTPSVGGSAGGGESCRVCLMRVSCWRGRVPCHEPASRIFLSVSVSAGKVDPLLLAAPPEFTRLFVLLAL